MRVTTIFAYLIGRRRAILDIASARASLGVGALLVLSAALARNYDRVSLVHEPWRLLGPFVASIGISGLLFLFIYGFARLKGMRSPGIGRAYGAFLALYWMMAPMAWLYGIPYERFLSPVNAAEANLRTLALVSVWRVGLMIRVVSVTFDLPVRTAFALVLLFVDIAALVALNLVPLPVIPIMGGTSPDHVSLAFAAVFVLLLSWVTLPVWIVMVLMAAFSTRNHPDWLAHSTPQAEGSPGLALAFAGLAVAAWAALLPFNQPQQQLAHRVETAYRSKGPSAALAVLSAHTPDDFPPGWEPPPRRYPREAPTDEFLDTLEALAARPHAVWVGDYYSRRFQERMQYDWHEWPKELLGQYSVQLTRVLTRLPRGAEMARSLQHADRGIEEWLGPDPDHPVTEDQRAAMKTLRQLAEQGRTDPPGDLNRPSTINQRPSETPRQTPPPAVRDD